MSETFQKISGDDGVSPEEKLLKVIQQGKKSVAASALNRGAMQPPPPQKHSGAGAPKPASAVAPKPVAAVKPVIPAKPAAVATAAAPAKPIELKKPVATKPAGASPPVKPAQAVQQKAPAKPVQATVAAQKKPQPATAVAKPAATKIDKDKQKAAEARLSAVKPAATPAAPAKPKSFGGIQALSATPSPAAPARKIKAGPMALLSTINRAIAAASVLIFVGVVWKLLADKPEIPADPAGVFASNVDIATNAPLSVEEVKKIASDRNIWVFQAVIGGNNPTSIAPPAMLSKLLAEKIKLEGVSISSKSPDRSFAALTYADAEGGMGTRFIRVNMPIKLMLPIGDGGTEKTCQLTLDEIHKGELVLLYEGTRVELSGRR